jgi:hypothetical protein
VGDTVLAYDALLQRVTGWIPSTDSSYTFQLPAYQDRPTRFVTAASTSQYLITAADVLPARSGLFKDIHTIMSYNPHTRTVVPVDRRELRYQYFYGQPNGYTVYATPFLAKAHIASVAQGFAFVPLDSGTVEVRNKQWMAPRRVRVPAQLRPFDRRVINQYRDSLLNVARGSSVDRIREVFTALPSPRFAPSILSLVPVGPDLWVETTLASNTRMSQWYVIDTQALTFRAAVLIPNELRVLGGNGSGVIVLHRDSLGVEVVSLYAVQAERR